MFPFQPPPPPGNAQGQRNGQQFSPHDMQQFFMGKGKGKGMGMGGPLFFPFAFPPAFQQQSGSGRGNFFPPPSPPPSSSPPPDMQRRGTKRKSDWFCESCGKDLYDEESYDLHLAEKHVYCTVPGCNFHAREEVMLAHRLTHVKDEEGKTVVKDEEESKKWVEARRKRFPNQKDESRTLKVEDMCKLEKVIRSGFAQSAAIKKRLREEADYREKENMKAMNQKNACIQWKKGRCTRGASCPFFHEKKTICKFYQVRGFCKHGEDCRHLHVHKALDTSSELAKKPHSQLLRKLLHTEVSKFYAQILQGVRHICKNNFFEEGEQEEEEEEELPQVNIADILPSDSDED